MSKSEELTSVGPKKKRKIKKRPALLVPFLQAIHFLNSFYLIYQINLRKKAFLN